MASKLIIVESPAKARTLGRYLGNQFAIKASMGHIRDLPEKKLSVDIDNDFEPQYQVIPSKKKTVDELRREADKAKEIYLATDPDREGEAIAWHISHLLGKTNGDIHRVMFHEITKQAVQDAVANPTVIDRNKVDAQQARRVLDRLVGYLVSQQLWRVIAKGLSAGRVQSVALRLISEREAEIEAFTPEEYWIISALAKIETGDSFEVRLVKMAGEEAHVPGGEVADKVVEQLKTLPAKLHDVRHRTTSQKPHAPFTTSTLQQEAARRLHMGVKRTMSTAQRLYEGVEMGKDGAVGLITYMRTDSIRVSKVAVDFARDFIKDTYGEKFLSGKPRTFASKKSAQDAHEAIRPTSPEWPPAKAKPFLKKDEYRLYELIWNRFMATQMAEAKYAGVTVEVGVGEPGAPPATMDRGAEGEPPYLLRARGRRLIFPGFRTLWGEEAQEDKEPSPDDPTELPEVFFKQGKAGQGGAPVAGDPASVDNVEGEQKFTQPPPRYSESTLVKTLDELGIGRPSTYAQIISTIQDRNYVERDERRKLKPTELGRTVNDLLVGEFENVFNVKFTARMEEALDKVEDGKAQWTETVRKFWEPFQKRIEAFKENRQEIKERQVERTGRTCPKCGEGELIVRWGKFGKFVACDQFPKCDYKENLDAEGEKRAEPEKTGRTCPKCEQGELVVRDGRYGKFIACNRYPKCKYTEEIPGQERKNRQKQNLPDVAVPCPRENCGGTIVPKKTRRGKLFFSCTNWKEKECPVAFWSEPVQYDCPQCGYPLMEKKAKSLVCPECKHKVPRTDEEPEDA